jgi:hypothetical protein
VSLWHENLVIDGAKIDPNVTDAIPKAARSSPARWKAPRASS